MYDIYLDFKGMVIEKVTNLDESELTFTTKLENKNIGSSVHIFLTTPLNKGKTKDIVVYWKTNEEQTAVSWVPAENTRTKYMEFLYTQCESVHCRSLIPMQDTPSMKFTYDLQIISERKYVTYASGNFTYLSLSGGKKYTHFTMAIPIPGYLIAVVSGALKEK